MRTSTLNVVLLVLGISLTCGTQIGFAGDQSAGPLSPGSTEFVARYITATGKGYTARPCGLDMNRNGIIGEPADRLVGDGKTADPDGDGVDEDILYVDSKTGSDEAGDGSAAKPFKTIQKALDSADGPADGAEDIVCISGVFHEQLMLKQEGVPGYYIRDGFQFPSNPTMIIGWDKDGDGEYPPYDKDDVAVLDGQDKLKLAINNIERGVSYLEIAHISIQDYGKPLGRDQRGAFVLRGRTKADVQSHLYFHDIETHRILKQATGTSNTIWANFFPPGGKGNPLRHVAFVNNLIDEYGGYAFRGGSRGGQAYRFQNNTLKMYGPEGDKVKLSFSAYVTGWKFWDYIDGMEILDNVVNANPHAWKPKAYTSGVGICQCTRNWTIRGNVFLDLQRSVILQPDAGDFYCQSRTINDVVIDRNIIRNTYDGYVYPGQAITIAGAFPGAPATAAVENVTITNNFISSTTGWNAGIFIIAGNFSGPQPGTITIAGNTIVGPFGLFGNSFAQHAISIYPQSKFRAQGFVIKNNIITNTGPAKRNMGVNYAPSNWVAENNIYDPASAFLWDNSIIGLDEWKKATGQDANSVQRKPDFVDLASGDLRLKADDKGAGKVGANITIPPASK